MRLSLLEVLACPECRGSLTLEAERQSTETVEAGTLSCGRCGIGFPIRRGIPRFVGADGGDSSFGLQWNLFRREQLDSADGAGTSADRLWSETQWSSDNLSGQRVLDVGCGAGRFLEVVSMAPCDVVGIDPSSAIDASAATVKERTNVDLVQADMFKMPFRAGAFDACYCIGVAQHTPSPIEALSKLPAALRQGGRLAVTVYERKPWTWLNGKYLLRPLTKRMNERALLWSIKLTMPILFPLTEVLFRLPVVGRGFNFVIPVANYVHLTQLTIGQRYRLALLDTFDRLAPAYDRPFTEEEVRTALSTAGIGELQRLKNSGVNMIGIKQ